MILGLAKCSRRDVDRFKKGLLDRGKSVVSLVVVDDKDYWVSLYPSDDAVILAKMFREADLHGK